MCFVDEVERIFIIQGMCNSEKLWAATLECTSMPLPPKRIKTTMNQSIGSVNRSNGKGSPISHTQEQFETLVRDRGKQGARQGTYDRPHQHQKLAGSCYDWFPKYILVTHPDFKQVAHALRDASEDKSLSIKEFHLQQLRRKALEAEAARSTTSTDLLPVAGATPACLLSNI
jgi:hypothetical protein